MTKRESPLSHALAAIEDGDRAAALAHALAAWQSCRHARIATIVEELGAQLANPETREALAGGTEKQYAWLTLARANDPVDIDPLLATLTGIQKKSYYEARLRELEGRADPRIARSLIATLEHPPIPGASGARAIVMTLELILAIADPRSIAALGGVARAIGNEGGLALRELRARLPSTRSLLGRKVRKLKVALSTTDAKSLAAIERRLAASRAPARSAGNADELFAAVYANPDDDAPRSVLADFLQERGDPRGEFIALQLARQIGAPRTRRESELLRTYARDWLGPLGPAVLKSGVVFERGFLEECVVSTEHERDAKRLARRPEWATVRKVEIRSWPASREALLNSMPVLRAVRGLSFVPDHASVEEVAISWLYDIDSLCKVVAPSLRRLELPRTGHQPPSFHAFWRSALCRQLTSLALYVDDFAAWLPEVAVRRGPSIELSSWQTSWKLTFADHTVIATHSVRFGRFGMTDLSGELVSILSAIPTPGSWRVVVAAEVKQPRALVAALKRFASYELAWAK